jgi:hypothetical protein
MALRKRIVNIQDPCADDYDEDDCIEDELSVESDDGVCEGEEEENDDDDDDEPLPYAVNPIQIENIIDVSGIQEALIDVGDGISQAIEDLTKQLAHQTEMLGRLLSSLNKAQQRNNSSK